METVCQVSFTILSRREKRRVEAILRGYLLSVADAINVTLRGSSPFSFFGPNHYRFRRFVRMLKPADIADRNNYSWTLNLTENVKNLLNQTNLMFDGSGRFFSGFHDPKFFRQGKEIASIISSETLLTLYIPDEDKAWLSRQGINLDNPEI